jgi:hypothetical protein
MERFFLIIDNSRDSLTDYQPTFFESKQTIKQELKGIKLHQEDLDTVLTWQ